MTLTLKIHPDPILREPSKRVVLFNDQLRAFIKDLTRLMLIKGGTGIAAVQVGVPKKIIVVLDKAPEGKHPPPLPMINPEIVESSGEVISDLESCLSLPGIEVLMPRHQKIVVRYHDLRGRWQVLYAKDHLARVIQHECDHLVSRLITDGV